MFNPIKILNINFLQLLFKIERSLFLPLLSSTQAEEEVVENVTIQNNVAEPQYFDYLSDDSSNEDMEYDPTNDFTSESDSDEQEEIDSEDLLINITQYIKKGRTLNETECLTRQK